MTFLKMRRIRRSAQGSLLFGVTGVLVWNGNIMRVGIRRKIGIMLKIDMRRFDMDL